MTLLAQSHVQLPDYIMLVGYFVLMLVIGAYFYRYMKGMKDYFSGGNTIPWWLSGASFFMSSFSVFAFVSYSALAFRYGWVAVTIYWVTIPATIFSVVLFAKKWRRARIDSPVEYLETRYSFGLRQLFTWQGVPVIVVDDALKLIAIGTFIAVSMNLPEIKSFNLLGVEVPLAQLGLHTPIRYTMLISAVIMLLYTLMGGLWAVAVTDFIQFVVMSVGIVILLPLSIHRAGGMTSFIDNTPKEFYNFVNAEYNWIYVGLLVLLYALAWSSVKWPLIQRYYCVRDEKEALKVGWFVVFLNVVGPPLMFLPAIAAQQFMGDVPDAEVYPRLCILLLPAGMLGLVIAAMFSATMSMLSSDYNACAGVLTNDVYRRLIHKSASQKELVLVGRLMTLLIGIFALAVAFGFGGTSGEELFRYMVTLFSIATAPVAVPMLLGLLSKRVTNLGATAGFFCGLAVGLGLFVYFYGLKMQFGSYLLDVGGLPEHEETALFAGLVWSPEKEELLFGTLRLKMEVVLFACNTLVTLIACLAVSLLMPMSAAARERVDAFHQRLATPIGDLAEDRAAEGGLAVVSPFKVVGISVLLIGLMMLGILWWVWQTGDRLAFYLDVGLGAALVVIGGLMARHSGRAKPAATEGT
ncbi:MAG: hypothetical protein ABIK89_08095 [Planctomycetota bacterium]